MAHWTYRRIPIEDLPDLASGPALDLARLWQAKRPGRAVTARRDLDPGDLQPWFGDLLIADVLDAPRDFRFRLFGTNIANAVGRDLTGRRLSDPDTLDDHAPALLKVLSEVVDGPTIATTAGGLYWQQRSYLRFTGLYLPLCDEGGRIRQILGHCTFTLREEEGIRSLVAADGLMAMRF